MCVHNIIAPYLKKKKVHWHKGQKEINKMCQWQLLGCGPMLSLRFLTFNKKSITWIINVFLNRKYDSIWVTGSARTWHLTATAGAANSAALPSLALTPWLPGPSAPLGPHRELEHPQETPCPQTLSANNARPRGAWAMTNTHRSHAEDAPSIGSGACDPWRKLSAVRQDFSKRKQQFLKWTHQRQQLSLPCSHQSPIYTARVEAGERTTTPLPFGESQIPRVISPPRPDGLWELTSCANPALTRAPKPRSVRSACRTSSRGKPNVLKNHPHFWDSDLQTGT